MKCSYCGIEPADPVLSFHISTEYHDLKNNYTYVLPAELNMNTTEPEKQEVVEKKRNYSCETCWNNRRY